MKRQLYYILLSLAADDRHGAGIVRDVLALTDGALKLWPATLYGALDELCEQGWIRELDRPPSDADAAGHKRWFGITPAGRRAVAGELARLQTMVTVARRRLSPNRGKA
jgi:DNA-binding PadR family transcriptional regulator